MILSTTPDIITTMAFLLTKVYDRFLWVRFQLDEISEAVTDDAICTTIQNLPKDLVETYARILTKIWNSPGRNGKFDLAMKIFKWVICARRPLTVEELSEAMAVSKDCDSLDMSKVPSGDGYRLLQSCGNLLTVDRNDRTVRLAHYTVRQFLVSDQPSYTTYGAIHFTLSEAEVETGVLCITYLNFSEFETQVIKREPSAMTANASTIQRSVVSAVRRGSALSEGDDFHIRLAGHRPQEVWSEASQQKYVLIILRPSRPGTPLSLQKPQYPKRLGIFSET